MPRDSRFDNAKFFAIYLVVFGHLIEPIIYLHPSFRFLYLCIYTVHIPLFSFVAGYFSPAKFSRQGIAKIVNGLVVPTLVFTVLYELFALLRTGSFSSYTQNLRPYWILWFLVSLATWRILLPLFARLPFYVPLSIGLSLAAGCLDNIGMSLSLSRTLYFFPFFLLGHLLAAKPAAISRLLALNKGYPIAVLALGAGIVYRFRDLPEQWLYGNSSFAALQTSIGNGVTTRLALYALSLSTALALLLLVSKRQTCFSALGRRSLTVYLWHGFLVLAFAKLGFHSYLKGLPPSLRLSCLALLALGITIVLAAPALQAFTARYLLLPAQRAFSVRKSA